MWLIVPFLLLSPIRPCAGAAEAGFRQSIAFPGLRLAVHMLPSCGEDSPALRRLPARWQDRLRPAV
jgi:hypothetical protein